jgi:acyl-CoA synthetase (AMP-forming)/AMP-acid ligase II
MDVQAYDAHLAGLWQKNWPEDVSRELDYPFGEIPLGDYLRRRAETTPDKPALIYYGTTYTFADLDQLSDRCAALLHQKGARAGDRIAVFLQSSPQFVVAFYGILKLGCVHVPVNPMFREHELQYELEDTGARIIIAQDQLMDLVRSVGRTTPLDTIFVTSLAEVLPAEPTIPIPSGLGAPRIACPDAIDFLPALAATTAAAPKVAIDLDAVAALNYTGGTTGMPKGCVHTQRHMIYTAATVCARDGGESASRIRLNFMPMFWIAGENAGLIVPIFCGATLVQMGRWDALGWMAAVDHYKVATAGLLVDNAVAVMDHPDVGRYDLTSLRTTTCSSFVKKLNLDYRRRWKALTGVTLIEAAWGMTETHTNDTFTSGMQADDWDLKTQPVFVGLPVPGTKFRICSFETGELMPLGTEGEIVVQSPSMLTHYWNKPEASTESLRNGWFHTGDIGMLDEDGYLHFLGRRKEMLKVNGMSVFPSEIEALLGQHPAVMGSGVIGIDDEKRGQAPLAFVILDRHKAPGLTAAELAAWCGKNMATYKVPTIRIVDALPMTATGKVKKEELKHLLTARSGG